MKSIIIDIRELSNSKEVYDARPNPFFAIFIYGLLAIVIIALVFCYFFKIDIVVKSNGIIRTNEAMSTVTNRLGGVIEVVNVEDGETVSKGSVLYTIEHNDLILQKNAIEKSLHDLKTDLDFMKRYKKSVESGKNNFNVNEDEYYTKYVNYYVNLISLSNDYEGTSTSLAQQLESVQSKIEYYKQQITCTEKLQSLITQDIFNNGTAFSNVPESKNRYDKYVSDYKSIVRQYNDKAISIQNDTNVDLNALSIEASEDESIGYKKLLQSVESEMSYFDSSDYYSNMFDQYKHKLADLTTQYEQACELYDLNKSLKGVGVSQADVESSEASKDSAYGAIAAYKAEFIASLQNKITELDNKIMQLKINQTSFMSKDQLLADNETEKAAALKNYKLENQVNYDTQLAQFRDNLRNLQDNETTVLAEINKITMLEIDDTQMPAKVVAYKNSELNSTILAIKQSEEKRDSLETNLSNMNEKIKDAIVCAQMDGVVNLSADLVEGDVLQSGTAVLTIVPINNSIYKTMIYVENKDIARLYEGMPINYDIYALPTKEYGKVTGKISNISQDIKTDASSKTAYYLVEATIDNTSVIDNEGNEAKIKVGMACQARMITERKRILVYLLQKINLLD